MLKQLREEAARANLGKEIEDGEIDSEEQRVLDIQDQFMADFKEQLEAENIRELEQEPLPKGLEEITPLVRTLYDCLKYPGGTR